MQTSKNTADNVLFMLVYKRFLNTKRILRTYHSYSIICLLKDIILQSKTYYLQFFEIYVSNFCTFLENHFHGNTSIRYYFQRLIVHEVHQDNVNYYVIPNLQ